MKLSTPDFYKELFQELDLDKLQKKFLQLLLKVQEVERGSLWIHAPGGYHCVEAVGIDSEKVKGITLDEKRPSIVGWVMKHGEMTIAEAGKDQRHFYEIEKGFRVKSGYILCYPLILASGEIYGAVELIETQPGGRLDLNKDFLDTLQGLVELGAVALGNALSFADKLSENLRLKKTLDQISEWGPIIGQSPVFLEVLDRARNFARTDFPVLITGQSGTGKELVARELHNQSPRRNKPFLVQNCSAIPDSLLESELFGYKKGAFTGASRDKAGLFEAAQGGTVFLDEIGDMPLNLQAKILRVLQNQEIKPLGRTETRQVDVRIIAATNQDLQQAITEGRFREDLYFRLGVLPLHLPSLRRRREDIPLLFNHFLAREARRMKLPPKSLSPQALDLLMDYPWPGNVRELENLAKYLLATAPQQVVTPRDLPAQFRQARPKTPAPSPAPGHRPETETSSLSPPSPSFDGYTWEELERDYVRFLLKKYKWNVTRAAQAAGLKRSTFSSRMKRLGISR